MRFKTTRSHWLLAGLAASMIGLASGQALAADGPPPTVKIENFTFEPATVTVKAGTAIIFENDDDIPHLVVANDKSFRSEALDTGDRYTVTLEKPGDFPYFCGMHPHMQGTIRVVP